MNDCRPSEVPSKDALCYHCGEPAVHKVDGHVYCDHCFRCHRDPRPNEAPCDAVLHYLGARYVCTKTAGHFENGTTLDDEAHGWTERPDPRVDKAEVEDWADGVDAAAGVVRAERAHAPTWAHATLDKLITTLEKLAENYPGRDARSDYPPVVVQLALAAHAVVKGRVPALSAEREGSDWKHSRISDSLTDKLATALEALGPCTANPTSKETP